MYLELVLANPLTRIPLQARAIIESAQQERKKQARRGSRAGLEWPVAVVWVSSGLAPLLWRVARLNSA